MANTPNNSLYESLQKWLNMRSHQQRIGILLIGWIVIYFCWYYGLLKPLRLERAHIAQQSVSLKSQIDIFQAESLKVAKEAEIRAAKQQITRLSSSGTKVEMASASDSDTIIKKILDTKLNVQFVSLRANAFDTMTAKTEPTDNALELVFNSSYFDTIAYLEQLENIPWCLSWDSMDYKVTHYPTAAVTLHLSIVSG